RMPSAVMRGSLASVVETARVRRERRLFGHGASALSAGRNALRLGRRLSCKHRDSRAVLPRGRLLEPALRRPHVRAVGGSSRTGGLVARHYRKMGSRFPETRAPSSYVVCVPARAARAHPDGPERLACALPCWRSS